MNSQQQFGRTDGTDINLRSPAHEHHTCGAAERHELAAECCEDHLQLLLKDLQCRVEGR